MKTKRNIQISKRLLSIATIALLNGQLYCDSTIDLETAESCVEMSRAKNKNDPCAGVPVPTLEKPCRRVDVHADFLYWQAHEDGLEYGTKMVGTPIIGAPSVLNTQLLDLEFEWNPGVRLGVGSSFDFFDCWGVHLNWTHMRNKARGNMSAAGIESQVGRIDTIVSPWVNLIFELRSGASNALAHWHVDYNTVDLDFGKELAISKTFSVSPYFGFRGAWLDQEYKVKYDSVFLLAEGEPSFTRLVTFKASNDFSGFGLRSGTELLCRINKNWHFFAQLAGNILYGRFKVHMKNLNDQGLGEGDTPPMPINFTAAENFWRMRLSFEETIGFGWETFLDCERYRLRFRAAYNLSQWPHQNELFYTLYFRGSDTVSSVPIRNQGDLGFQGIQLGAQLDF